MKITAALVRQYLRKKSGVAKRQDHLWIEVGAKKPKTLHFRFYWRKGGPYAGGQYYRKIAELDKDSSTAVIAAADKQYQTMLGNLRQGRTPDQIEATLRRAEEHRRREAQTRPTVHQLFTEYFEKHLKGKKSAKADRQRYKNHIRRLIGDKIAAEVERLELQAVIDRLVSHRKLSQAYYIGEMLPRVWHWGFRQGYALETANAERLNRPDKPERDRVATERELKRILQKGTPVVKGFLFMGQRVADTLQMEWEDFDTARNKKNWLEIPSHKYKTDRVHRVYITKTVLNLIGEHQERYCSKADTTWCWSGYKSKTKGHISDSQCYADWKNLKLDSVRKRSEPDNLQRRDIRRTFYTWIEKTFRYELAGATAGHKRIGIGRIYGRYEYENEKMDVMLAWEKYLKSLVSKK